MNVTAHHTETCLILVEGSQALALWPQCRVDFIGHSVATDLLVRSHFGCLHTGAFGKIPARDTMATVRARNVETFVGLLATNGRIFHTFDNIDALRHRKSNDLLFPFFNIFLFNYTIMLSYLFKCLF